MASKHLKELLNEDQEPFVLKTSIHQKLHHLKPSPPKTHLHLKRRKPIPQNPPFSYNLCKNACFSASSPDAKKSPLFDFRSPAKSPCRNSSSLFFQIPARTSALLLEAALRIQKKNVSKKPKSRFGAVLFESILKKIKKNQKKSECNEEEKRVSVKDIIRWEWDSSNSGKCFREEKVDKEELMVGFKDKMGFSGSCTSTLSSSAWSESNEDKSFDPETPSSRSEDMEFYDESTQNADFSPFRFVLHNHSLSPCRASPKQSPDHNNAQLSDNEKRRSNKCEEEEKEQNSPVSVLDPPFEDEDDHDIEEAENDHFQLDHNFTNVQRIKQQLLHKLRRFERLGIKQQLLHKLRRFERLGELDPVKLETRIAEHEDEDREDEGLDNDHDDGSDLSDNGDDDLVFVKELLTQSSNCHKIPSDMKRLVSDLVVEEGGEENSPFCMELVAEKVSKRLESWKEVGSHTIDMMVELDLRRDANEWAKNSEQMQETAFDIELAIFELLADELSEELVQCSRH